MARSSVRAMAGERVLRVGDAIRVPLLVDGDGAARALTRTDFVRYAGASGDFNPMHHDDLVAQAAGQPSVFGHGMLTAGLVASVIVRHFGVTAMRAYAVRFTRPTWPDEVLTATLTVVGERDADGVAVLDLECAVENAAGETKLTGTATVVRP